ncbi:cytochrome P450 2K4-like isoform 2-T2 [Anomaloglossus baeobatrachus]|uniref:cytochrome P450 2K4-like isoform X2 n=1 Tax=Anomaloglossus baeobatrachus TaxID=238106 RepID=UPI003F4F635B
MDLVTVLLAIVVILFLANAFMNQKQKNYKNFPPGPKPLPIIGNVLMIDIAKPYKTYMELSKTYGPVFSVQIGMTKSVVLCGFDIVKDALVNHADVFSDRPQILLKIFNNYGIALSNGENWKVMRKFTLSSLRDFGMGKKTIEDKIIEEAKCLVQKMKSYGGKPFEDLDIINAAVANIIVAILLSHRFEYEDPTFVKLINLIDEGIRLLGSPWICGKPESTEYYHNENLTALIGNLFVAAMETTSTTLRWGLLLMIKYPEIQQKVHNEIEQVIGSAHPQMEHRKEMPYTDAVIHEIQRFGDIIPHNVPHAVTEDVTFRGYFIPKGTVIIPLLHSALRDKAYFAKPDQFYPEHFLDTKGDFKKNEAFVPYSIGKRSCAGETLAKMELFIFFTTLLQSFTFQSIPGAKLDLTPAPGAANPPKPFEICAIARR